MALFPCQSENKILNRYETTFSIPACAAGASGYITIEFDIVRPSFVWNDAVCGYAACGASNAKGLQLSTVSYGRSSDNKVRMYVTYYAPQALSSGISGTGVLYTYL